MRRTGVSLQANVAAIRSLVDAHRAVSRRTRSGFRVLECDQKGAGCLTAAWLDLQARALEANPFLCPNFVLTNCLYESRFRPRFLFVFAADDYTAESLIGLIVDPGADGGHLVPVTTPLLDADRAVLASQAIAEWVVSGAGSFTLSGIDPRSAGWHQIAKACTRLGLSLTLAQGSRAKGSSAFGTIAEEIKCWALARRATLTWSSVGPSAGLEEALSRHLELPRSNTGTGGGAMLKCLTRGWMKSGSVRIVELRQGKDLLASAVLVSADDHEILWRWSEINSPHEGLLVRIASRAPAGSASSRPVLALPEGLSGMARVGAARMTIKASWSLRWETVWSRLNPVRWQTIARIRRHRLVGFTRSA